MEACCDNSGAWGPPWPGPAPAVSEGRGGWEGAHQECQGGDVRFSYHDMDIYAAMGSWVSHHIRQALRTYSRQPRDQLPGPLSLLLLGSMLGGIPDPLGYS